MPLVEDLRFALRILRKSPGFTAVAVFTLALGVASNTTVFSWIDTVLLRPIPGVINPHELAAMEAVSAGGGGPSNFPHPDFRDFQREMTLVSGVVATHLGLFTIGPLDRPQRVMGQVVSANFFAVLGVRPFLGRMFLPEEDRDAPGGYPIAVVSHRLWKTLFNADPGIAGRVERINGRQFTIVGVAPPEFHGSFGGAVMDVWVPLSMVVQVGNLNTWAASDRNARFLGVMVRRKPGVTNEQVQAEANAVAARIAAAYPDTHRGVGARVLPLWQSSTGLQATLLNPLRILMIVGVLVLLIACANVANLLMTRSVARRREFGVRMALGAGRAKLIRQLLAEAAPLAGAGAVLGILLAQWMTRSMSLVFPSVSEAVRRAIEPLLYPKPNATVLFFTALIAAGAAVLSTVVPALFVSHMELAEAMKEGGRSGKAGARTHRARGLLVIAEVALAAVALIGGGVAVRSFQRLLAIEKGFDERNVLVAHFHLSTNGYSLEQEKQFCRNLRLRLETAPGIEQAVYADSVPLSIFSPPSERVQSEGTALDEEGVHSLPRSVVAPGYFGLMRIPLVAGRDFTEQDDGKTPRVIIVNETFARKYFPGRDVIGRRVRVSGVPSTIVGVAKDSKYRNPPEPPTPFFYGPFRQIFFSGHNNFMYIRASGSLDAARATLRREVAALDPNGGLYEDDSLTSYTEAGLFAERIIAGLLSALGVLSLVLAAIGLYSVMSYAVSERTQEIGIRMALGARPGQVVGMVVGKGLAMACAGVAAGAALSAGSMRLLSSRMNLPVSAEPAAYGFAGVVLILVAIVASGVPALRATKVDPTTALRAE